MNSERKRTVTLSLILLAGIAVITALCLASVKKDAIAAGSDPQLPEPASTKIRMQKPARTKAASVPVNLPSPEQVVKKPEEKPKVDVVFVLDTTGSMSGLIAGAKRKIWSIANQVLNGQPRPDVRLGLVGYRDLGDVYVTRRFPLSENIDQVYENLTGLHADGGGDTPEHVNRALADAIYRMQWRKGQNVLKMIFLVGDAPPHEGRQGLYSTKLSQVATDMGIVINAVQCGRLPTTKIAWQRIANTAGGMFASIRQDGGMVAISTPMDERLKELNMRLTQTLIPVGDMTTRRRARRRMSINAAMDSVAQAESATYRSKSGRIDGSDLLASGKSVEDLSEENLPAPLVGKSSPEKKAYVARIAKKRSELQQEIDDLSKKRDVYIKGKNSKTKDSLDYNIGKALKLQGKKAGIRY